ncbi:2-oxoglutarate dehydrogenase, E2 component, dihydrolipoamide succinyltransferase domain protein [Mycobacterium xenopi 3993]|nr:2-oxoglutarate dehydrogenase, E2 component, dihydrolipoamide succinyltransferase domain protein [Mycobacterium xenopi 3993]
MGNDLGQHTGGGDGISVSTLSVETSNRGSSTSTVSPSCLSQRVTVPR